MRRTLELLGDVTLAFPLLTLTVASFLLHWPPGQYPPPAVAGWAVTGSSSHRHGGTPHSPGTMVTVTVDTQVTQPSHVPWAMLQWCTLILDSDCIVHAGTWQVPPLLPLVWPTWSTLEGSKYSRRSSMPLLRENFLSEHLICCVNEVPGQEMAPLFTHLDYTSALPYWCNIMIAASVFRIQFWQFGCQ